MSRILRVALSLLLLGLGACDDSPGGRGKGRVLVLGLDGMDHGVVTAMLEAGELPNLARLAQRGGFVPLQTSRPPQSPVAWSNFITGTRTVDHGIFDFVHRDPHQLTPYLSTSLVEAPRRLALGPWAIPLGGGEAKLLRLQKPFWWYLSEAGVAATVIKIPSHFPPRDDGDAHVLSGMGTPDLLGTYGTFSVLTDDATLAAQKLAGGRSFALRREAPDRLAGRLTGPANPFSSDDRPLELPVTVAVDEERRGALVQLGAREVLIGAGEWSEFVRLEFPLLGGLNHLSAVVRLYLKQLRPNVVIYVSPLNIDPLDPALPVSSPPTFAAQLAERAGLYFTQGMPEESKALAAKLLSPEAYLTQANLVLARRQRLLDVALEDFDEGFLFFYFSSTDQITHMFWRAHDPTHPAHTAADEPYADVLRSVYRRLDRVVGHVVERLEPEDLLLVMSDHGFGPASYLFDLNRWLVDRGYLVLRDKPAAGIMGHVDWKRTQAYGLGLNGLYLNLRGREAHGAIAPARRKALLARISRGLRQLRHPATAKRVVTSVFRPEKLGQGEGSERSPDLIVGYNRGIKVSDASAQGLVGAQLFEINRGAWSGDHCGDRRFVPGILFANRPLRPGQHTLHDLAPTILGHFGIAPPQLMIGKPVLAATKKR